MRAARLQLSLLQRYRQPSAKQACAPVLCTQHAAGAKLSCGGQSSALMFLPLPAHLSCTAMCTHIEAPSCVHTLRPAGWLRLSTHTPPAQKGLDCCLLLPGCCGCALPLPGMHAKQSLPRQGSQRYITFKVAMLWLPYGPGVNITMAILLGLAWLGAMALRPGGATQATKTLIVRGMRSKLNDPAVVLSECLPVTKDAAS